VVKAPFDSVECRQWSYVSQSTCVIAGAADDLSDVHVLVYRQSRVQCDTKQLDSVTERHCPCDIDATCR